MEQFMSSLFSHSKMEPLPWNPWEVGWSTTIFTSAWWIWTQIPSYKDVTVHIHHRPTIVPLRTVRSKTQRSKRGDGTCPMMMLMMLMLPLKNFQISMDFHGFPMFDTGVDAILNDQKAGPPVQAPCSQSQSLRTQGIRHWRATTCHDMPCSNWSKCTLW